ncbi:hypothetical protein [Novosphingobium sp. CECT 9465]|uniref:hypothetical protein n=1 Tax=Novosphingobium sp. CECT 9465 TaxID=2829794 RepID=UPI001E3BB672|nr:hypothetical protein [Novosphingobium sp. CECT 9465]CAH0495863.1 hypothetical protein NVSP9465_00884 [Novosphingobium sp. CECT 9465]
MGFKRGVAAAAAALALVTAAPAVAQASNGVGTAFELAFWQSVTGSDDATLYEAYLQQYPAGTFSALARAKVASLRKGTAPAIAAAPQAPLPPMPAPVVPALASPALASPALASPAMTAPIEPAPMQVAVAPPARIYNDAAQAAADVAMLAELAKSQEVSGATLQVAVANGFALPPRPTMNEVPDLSLPPAFCSAEARNAFHETRYKPVMELARDNNAAAVAHMQRLQQEYDRLQLAGDPTPMNVIAAEASAYQQEVAAIAYKRQVAMVQQFDAIMAVPVTACQIAAAK